MTDKSSETPSTEDTPATATGPVAGRAAPQPVPHLARAGAGTPTLLLHGWGASSDLFAATMRGLGDGFDLIAPDFPGFGKTAAPPAPWGVGEYVDWTLALMDWLGVERANLVGHSFGGRVAIKLAALHPERVARIVLTDAAGIRPQRDWRYHVRVRSFKMMRTLAQWRYTPQPLREWAGAQVARQGSPDYKAASGTVRGSFVRVVNEDLREYLGLIRSEAFRCKSITMGLLDFSRTRTSDHVTINLSDVIQSAVRLLSHQKRDADIQFKVDVAPDLLPVSGDPGQLQQAVIALATNALDAMGESGMLTIVGRNDDEKVVVEVSDTGVGISPENLPKIFEPFFTTKEIGRGTGLGLAVCYGILTEHGGTLDVQSTLGTGTTFTITLSAVKLSEEQTG